MLIDKEMRLAEIIHHDYMLLPVINRFNMHLGVGDKTIAGMCDEKGVNIDFFLTVINTFHDDQYFPAQQLKQFPAVMLVNYLKQTHRFYLKQKLPVIETQIENMEKNCAVKGNTLILLFNFFKEYSSELIHHINREEEVVYPYILTLEKSIELRKVTNDLNEKMKNYTITNYKQEHENVVEKLFDLKNLIIKYLPETRKDAYCHVVLRELFGLEHDLNNHSRIENLVLLPKIEEMEQRFKQITR